MHFDIYDSNDDATSNLDVVTSRRSAILSCPFGQYSRTKPRVAKPVSIPVVPLTPGDNMILTKITLLSTNVDTMIMRIMVKMQFRVQILNQKVSSRNVG